MLLEGTRVSCVTDSCATPGTPAVWAAERGRGRVHFLGGRHPLPFAWSAPDVEALIETADEFWHEVPPMTPESQGLVFQYGIDPEAPLESRLTADELTRVYAAGEELGVAREVLAPFRPWLAGQVLKMASQSQRGVSYDSSPDDVFRACAERAGIPIRAEFDSTESLVELFTNLPRRAEVELLLMDLDDLEQDPVQDERRAKAWLRGELQLEIAWADEFFRSYPMLHAHVGAARNRAWVPRVERVLDAGIKAFIVVGIGHMLGPASIPELLGSAGIQLRRA